MKDPIFRFDNESDELIEGRLKDNFEYVTTRKTMKKSDYIGTENILKDGTGLIRNIDSNLLTGIEFSENDILVSNIRPYLRKFWRSDCTGIASSDVLVMRSKNICPNYFYHLISRQCFFDYVMEGAKGTKMPRGDKKHIGEMPVSIPSLPEQEKIADFLSSYDEKISIQRERVEALERRKKGLLQKVFSQEIRFKADDGSKYPEWEYKKIGDIGTLTGGGTPSTKDEKYWKGSIPWISSSDLREDDIRNVNIWRYITEDAIKKSATKLIPKTSILIITRVGVGKVAIAPDNICTSQDFANLVDFQGVCEYIIYAIKLSISEHASQDSRGTSIKGITSASLKEYKIPFPSIDEQQKIGDFFIAIDDQINIEKERLATMETIKKGLLQGLFC